MTQPELFPNTSEDQRPRRLPFPLFPGRFLRVKVAYEDMIFGALGLILLLLGGFCMGVERGKGFVSRDGILETSPGVSSAVAHAAARPAAESPAPAGSSRGGPGEPAVPVLPVLPVIPAAVSSPSQEKLSDPLSSRGTYVIQLASYVGMPSAQEEVRRLGRQGVFAQVIHQGKYFELRAVGFRSRADAEQAWTGLRKTYRDAFIKRLPSSSGG